MVSPLALQQTPVTTQTVTTQATVHISDKRLRDIESHQMRDTTNTAIARVADFLAAAPDLAEIAEARRRLVPQSNREIDVFWFRRLQETYARCHSQNRTKWSHLDGSPRDVQSWTDPDVWPTPLLQELIRHAMNREMAEAASGARVELLKNPVTHNPSLLWWDPEGMELFLVKLETKIKTLVTAEEFNAFDSATRSEIYEAWLPLLFPPMDPEVLAKDHLHQDLRQWLNSFRNAAAPPLQEALDAINLHTRARITMARQLNAVQAIYQKNASTRPPTAPARPPAAPNRPPRAPDSVECRGCGKSHPGGFDSCTQSNHPYFNRDRFLATVHQWTSLRRSKRQLPPQR